MLETTSQNSARHSEPIVVREGEWFPLARLAGSSEADQQRSWLAEIDRAGRSLRADLRLAQMPVAYRWTDGPELRFSGVVGALTVRRRIFHIIPKYVRRDGWEDALLVILRRARGFYSYRHSPIDASHRRISFVDHMAFTFVQELRQALQLDPIRVYAQREERSVYLRGRLDIERHMQSPITERGRLHCIVDYLDDINEFNDLLLWATNRFRQLAVDPRVRQALQEIAGQLPKRDAEIRPPARLPMRAPSQYSHFRAALEIASTLARGAQTRQGNGSGDGYGYVLDMSRVFERFVAATLSRAVDLLSSDLSVVEQLTSQFASPVTPHARAYYTRPDNVVRLGAVPVALVDAKYKRLADADEGVKTRPHNADLYQLFASSVAQKVRLGVLVYPADTAGASVPIESWHVDTTFGQTSLAAVAIDLSGLHTRADLHAVDSRFADALATILSVGKTQDAAKTVMTA